MSGSFSLRPLRIMSEEPDGSCRPCVLKGGRCGRELHRFESCDRTAVTEEIERQFDTIGGFRFPALGEGAA